jgi:hypothetical protein
MVPTSGPVPKLSEESLLVRNLGGGRVNIIGIIVGWERMWSISGDGCVTNKDHQLLANYPIWWRVALNINRSVDRRIYGFWKWFSEDQI